MHIGAMSCAPWAADREAVRGPQTAAMLKRRMDKCGWRKIHR